LDRRPKKALLIKRLVVGAEVPKSTSLPCHLEKKIIQLAQNKWLVNLERLWWFGQEDGPSDKLWLSLQKQSVDISITNQAVFDVQPVAQP
jgi:hypothetical protein